MLFFLAHRLSRFISDGRRWNSVTYTAPLESW